MTERNATQTRRKLAGYDWVIPDDAFLVSTDWRAMPKALDGADCLDPCCPYHLVSAPDPLHDWLQPLPAGWAPERTRLCLFWPEMDIRRIESEVKASGGTILWPGDVLPGMDCDEALHLENWIDVWMDRGKRIHWRIPKGMFLLSHGDTEEDITDPTFPLGSSGDWFFYLRDEVTGPLNNGEIKETYSVMWEWSGMKRPRITALVEAAGRHILWAGEIVPNVCAAMADEIMRS